MTTRPQCETGCGREVMPGSISCKQCLDVYAEQEWAEMKNRLDGGATAAVVLSELTVRELVDAAYDNAKEKGFYATPEAHNVPLKLALIHAEVSEALECLRASGYTEWATDTGKPEGFAVELADTVIRIADLCGYLKIDLTEVIVRKMAYNKTRPRLHGKKF